MVRKSSIKRIKRKAKNTRKSLIVILLIFAFMTTIFITTNRRGFTSFLSGTQVPFSGDISFVGISVESEEERFSPVGQFSNNIDGVPNWIDYLDSSRTLGDWKTGDFPDLIGCPGMLPETSWSFSTISHIDASLSDPKVIDDATLPSTFTVVDGYYTEVYRYATDIFVRVHANAEMDFLGPRGSDTYSLTFTNGIDIWLSRYIGEYAPMYEVYSKVGISIDAVNSSIIGTGADMAANGEPEVRFWPWAASPDWDQDDSWDLNDAYRYIQDNLHGGAVINNNVMQTGFDMSQGFNIVDKVEGIDSYYEFNIGFNYLGVPGCFYNYYDIPFLLWGWHQGLELLDMEIRIPVTFQVVVVYDIASEGLQTLYDLYPQLMNPGTSVHIIGTQAIPENSTYGDYFSDNPVIGVYESIPGFEWLEGELGAVAFVVMSVILGFGVAMIFRRS